MEVNISDRKFKELIQIYEKMQYNQVLAVAALALEREWFPFVEGLKESGFPDDVISELLQLAEQWMQLIWERVKSGHFCQDNKKRFEEIRERYSEVLDGLSEFGAELEGKSLYLDSALSSDSECFFNESECDLECCADAVCGILDMIEDIIVDSGVDKEQLTDVLNYHPMIIEELKRIDLDVELVQDYLQNMCEILKRREEYHKLNLYN